MEEDTIFEFNIIFPCFVSDVFILGVPQKTLIDIDNLASKSLINHKQCVDNLLDKKPNSIPAPPTVRRK